MSAHNFFLVDQRSKYDNFISPNMGKVVADQVLFWFRYVDTFRRYLRSKSKVVKNSDKFWKFSVPNFMGRASLVANFVSKLSRLSPGTSSEKVS